MDWFYVFTLRRALLTRTKEIMLSVSVVLQIANIGLDKI